MPYDFEKNKKTKRTPEMAVRAKKTKDAVVRGFDGRGRGPTGKKPTKSTTRAY